MLHIAVCDDNEAMVFQVENAIDRFFRSHCVDCKIQTYQVSENLRYDLQDGMYFDLFLLDIEMPGIGGMDIAKVVYDTMPAAKIIFITSYLEYAISAYELSVFRYIPKTIIDEKLPLALEDFYKLYRLERNEFYTIEVKNHVEQIPYREILYILKDGKYAIFHLAEGKIRLVRLMFRISKQRCFAFVFILCSVYFYDQIRRIRQEQENTALQNRLLTKNYQMAKTSYESNARLYHDMGNHFSMLQNYLADGKVEEAQAYLKRISGDRAAYSVECRTGIEAVDYILSQKMEVALQHNIETTIHAEYPKECNIDPVDLCTTLTNLLDNAIEACGRMPEGSDRKLTVTIRRIKRFIIIRIENSSIEEPVINKGNFLTSKQDRQNHGWGMRNVKSAVEKYHGAIEYEYCENMFTVSVMLFYQ